MGEITEHIEAKVAEAMANRSAPVSMIQRNPIWAMLATMLAGGTLGGGTVDQFFGAASAREEATTQIGLVVEAHEDAALQYQERIDALSAEVARLQGTEREMFDLLQACQEARVGDAE